MEIVNVTLVNTTLFGNSASGSSGGGLRNVKGFVLLSNGSRFAGNRAHLHRDIQGRGGERRQAGVWLVVRIRSEEGDPEQRDVRIDEALLHMLQISCERCK